MSWRGSEGPPRFGRRGARWFREVLANELKHRVYAAGERLGPEAAMPFAVSRYARAARRFVKWHPAKEYRGARYSAGIYVVDWDGVLAAWPSIRSAAIVDCDRAEDAERFQTLDAWLEADRRGLLRYQGATEPSAWRLLREKAKLPSGKRICASCDEPFPETRCGRGYRVRCEKCLREKRIQRWELAERLQAERRREVDFARMRRMLEHIRLSWGLTLEEFRRLGFPS